MTDMRLANGVHECEETLPSEETKFHKLFISTQAQVHTGQACAVFIRHRGFQTA